jgi:stage II sporulation protein AA (anti-sigma F factor antagonist)
MDITETRSAGVVTLALSGRLDGTSSGGLETKMLALIDAGDRRFIIDMANVDFMSSVGLRAFVVIAKGLHAVGGRIVLCAVQPPIKQLFELTGLNASFTMRDTREDAAALLAS